MRLCNSSHGSSGRNGNGQIPKRSTALGNSDEVDPMQIDLTKLIQCRLVVVVVVVGAPPPTNHPPHILL